MSEPRHMAPSEDSKGLPFAVELVITLALALGLSILARRFVVESYEIPTGSMLETIQIGDRLIGEKISYRFGSPSQGDIVTFNYVDPDSGVTETLIKRVIAVGGQTVDLVDGVVYVDGVALEEPYTHGLPSYSLTDVEGSAGIAYPYVVPEGCVWVMGDNRTNSRDSRYFGPVDEDEVTSRAVFIFWPFSDARWLAQ